MRKVFVYGALAVVALVGAWTAASYVMVWGIEEAPYEVVERRNGYELRSYEPVVLAKTVVGATGNDADGQAFRELAGYIFGGNAGDQTIAMTAPVLIDRDGGRTEMSFVLPKAIDEASAPKPKSGSVEVATRPAVMIAARRFTWFAGEAKRNVEAQALLAALKADGIQPKGRPVYAAYNPPFSIPFMKRHEMLVPVARPTVK